MVRKYSRIIKSFIFFNVICIYLFLNKYPMIIETVIVVNISLIIYLLVNKIDKS